MRQFIIAGAAVVDVLAAGTPVDVFETGSSPAKDILMSFGGDALNEAVVLSRLGGQVTLISKVGCDRAGQAILQYCRENGISTECIRECEDISTGINIVMVTEDGERHFITNPGSTLRRLTAEDIISVQIWDKDADKKQDDEREKSIFCLASLFVSESLGIPEMEKVLVWAKEQNFVVCADMTKPKHGEKAVQCAAVLKHLDYLFANQAEGAMLTGKDKPEEIAEILYEQGVSHVIIKCGAKGCYVYGKNQVGDFLNQYVETVPSKKCIDTTGAGDSFAAGFLYALSKEKDFIQCARFGNACGSLAVEQTGAAAWTEDEKAIEALHASIEKVV